MTFIFKRWQGVEPNSGEWYDRRYRHSQITRYKQKTHLEWAIEALNNKSHDDDDGQLLLFSQSSNVDMKEISDFFIERGQTITGQIRSKK